MHAHLGQGKCCNGIADEDTYAVSVDPCIPARSTAAKFMVLEDGGQLPVPPQLTSVVEQEYHVYERELCTYEGIIANHLCSRYRYRQ